MTIDLNLTPMDIRDIDSEFMKWYQNTDKHLDYFTGSRRSFTKDEIQSDFRLGLELQNCFYYIINTSSGEKIGNIKIGPIDRNNKTSDLVCLIGNRNFLGKGLASKAIAIANDIAFSEHDIRRLQSGMYADNIPSIKAYIRAGWFVEATLRGYYLVNEKAQDRVCVACLNPKYFNI